MRVGGFAGGAPALALLILRMHPANFRDSRNIGGRLDPAQFDFYPQLQIYALSDCFRRVFNRQLQVFILVFGLDPGLL